MSNENESTVFEPNENNTSEAKETAEETKETAASDVNVSADNEAEAKEETQEGSPEEKPVLPRKRKIVKNNALLISVCITGAAIAVMLGWKLFFDQSIIGKWHYEINMLAETSDTPDTAVTDTNDEASSVRSIEYEFLKDGTCNVTYGTMTVTGTYQLASMEETGNVISGNVYYGYSPVFFGTYKYKVKGNIFTGKKLELENAYYADDSQTLDKGAVKDLLTPYKDKKLDEKLTGKWYDSENDITYEFTEDGELYRTTPNGMCVRHLYTIMQDNLIMTKYYGDKEETYTYSYEFKDNVLYIDGFVMQKLDR